MLADYDAHRPNEIFAERGTEWLTLAARPFCNEQSANFA